MPLRFVTCATLLRRSAATFLLIALMLTGLSVAALAHAGSIYVPVDHWAYAVAERLAALTGTQSEIAGMRPWTRSQFASFVERARKEKHDSEAEALQKTLETEFAPELGGQREAEALESAYVRTTQIAGTPLRDSYHFGQSFTDDFGRNYGQGFNAITGASGYLQDRAGLLYVRGEYQHAASLRAPSQATIAKLATIDQVTSAQVLTQGSSEVDHLRLLDAYVGASFGRWTATLGKQNLWWGPDTGGAFLESNNAEPIWMARVTNDVPYRIPLLGKTRVDLYYGQLQGHKQRPGAWTHGEKLSFQPFKDFEIGFTRTVVFLGAGRPFTWHRLWISYFNVDDGSPNNKNAVSTNGDPGDRRSGVDFSWKLPKIPVTLYSDSFSDDEPSPLASPKRSSFRPGLYVAKLPGVLRHLDLRAEGGFTTSEDNSIRNGYNYWNLIYKDGYTNKGQLIGDAMGRAGVTWQAWSTYWISPRDKVQVSYRNRYISPKFLQGGGTQNDFRTTTNLTFRRNLELELGVQSERYVMPLLTGSTQPKYDISGWAGIRYTPEHKVESAH